MRRFLSLSESWVLPFARNGRGVRILKGSPHYHRAAPQRQFQRCPFSCRGGVQRASSTIDELSLSSKSVALGADSTIYALSTAPGRAAIAIIRISGPACLQVASSLENESGAKSLIDSLNRFIEHYVPEHVTQSSVWRRYEDYTTRRKLHRRIHSSTLVH